MADRTSQRDQGPAPTPDELEQRRRADGSMDDPDGFAAAADDTPLTPDVLEQRQRADGSFDDPDTFRDGSDTPLTPDVLEQRQVVEGDDEPPAS